MLERFLLTVSQPYRPCLRERPHAVYHFCGTPTMEDGLSDGAQLECCLFALLNPMGNYWNEDESYSPELTVNRRRLVEQFNRVVGKPGPDGIAFQDAFIAEKVTYDEAVSYVRYVEHMIAAADLSST